MSDIIVINPQKDDSKNKNVNKKNCCCQCVSNSCKSCDNTHPLPLSEKICFITNKACDGGYGLDDARCCAFILTPITFVLDTITYPFRCCYNWAHMNTK